MNSKQGLDCSWWLNATSRSNKNEFKCFIWLKCEQPEGQEIKDIFKKTPKDENILFWADSHFPGYDLGLSAIDAEKDESIRLPLWNELLLIKESRPQSKDVILMDDLMIFSEIEVYFCSKKKKLRGCFKSNLLVGFQEKYFLLMNITD